MTPTLTADDEEQLALDIAERTVAEIAVTEARMAQARARLDQLMLDVSSLTTDEERQEMWLRTQHVVHYLRALEAGQGEAAEDYMTAMLEIQRNSRRPPYVAAHIEEGRIAVFTSEWVSEAMPALGAEEHAVVVRALLAEGRIRAGAEAWVDIYLPSLEPDERAHVVHALLAAPPEAPDTRHHNDITRGDRPRA